MTEYEQYREAFTEVCDAISFQNKQLLKASDKESNLGYLNTLKQLTKLRSVIVAGLERTQQLECLSCMARFEKDSPYDASFTSEKGEFIEMCVVCATPEEENE